MRTRLRTTANIKLDLAQANSHFPIYRSIGIVNMSDLSDCTAPNDYSSLHGFTGHFQVSNTTASPYSNLYLNPPSNTSWGLATLTSDPQKPWHMGGGIHYMCDRAAYLMQGSSLPGESDIWSGIQINIDEIGHAPVIVLTEWNANLVFNVTEAFYVETLSEPLSLSTQNPGSYFGMFCDFYFVRRYIGCWWELMSTLR